MPLQDPKHPLLIGKRSPQTCGKIQTVDAVLTEPFKLPRSDAMSVVDAGGMLVKR